MGRRLWLLPFLVVTVGCAPRITTEPVDERSYVIGQEGTARVGQPILTRTLGERSKAKIWQGLFEGGWKETDWAYMPGTVHHELLYQGGNDDEIEVGYREYRITKEPLITTPPVGVGTDNYQWEPESFISSAPFYQQSRYKRSRGPTRITSYTLDVLSADDKEIRYIVRSE